MITLDNFESFVPYKILQRGQEYYEMGTVSHLVETYPGKWEAIVEGTENYSVEVSIENGELDYWDCDCPYDGEICKHVVATLLAIRNNNAKVKRSAFAILPAEPALPVEEVIILAAETDKLLSLVQPQELTKFVYEYASQNKDFREKLLKYIATKKLSGSANVYTEEVHKAFNITVHARKSRYRDYFDEYDWNAIFDKVESLLVKADLLLASGNLSASLAIALQILRSIGENYDDDLLYCDDISVPDFCERAGDLIMKVLQHPSASPELKKYIVEELHGISRISIFQNYDICDVDDLLMQANLLTKSPEDTLKLLDDVLKERKDTYDLYEWVLRKVEFLLELNKQKEADATIRQYLYLPQIRKREVEKLISAHQYDKAILLIDEGIELARSKEHPGTMSEWLELKLQIHEKEKNTSAVIAIYRQLFIFSRGSMDYYHKLKKLISAAEWKDFLHKMMQETNFSGSSFSNVKADIYVAEKDNDNLFMLLSSAGYDQLDMLMQYAIHLKETHSEPLLVMFTSLLRDYAEQNMGRDHYQFIAQALYCMQRLKGGDKFVRDLVSEFRVKYKRRSAMMEELAKF